MKRIVGLADPGPQHRRWLLAALVLLALLSLAATLATSLSLAHGVEEIKRGLGRIESDLGHNLPEREGELGEISRAVNRMIRHRQKLEAELHREDRLRSMGRLVAAVAHEVRNPLNGIRLSAQLLERQAGEGRQQVGAIIEEVDRLDRLVRELLIFEKSRSAKVEVQSLNAAIDGAWNLLRAQALERGVSLEVDRTEDVPALFDAAALRQVLLNLMLNGIEAMPDGGRLTARMGAKSAWAEIRLANSGKPLAADVQEHLFEMFYSTKSEGAGLGLAVSRELTRSMRGTLEYDAAEADPTFVIRLPQSNDAESHDTDRRG
jgi:signal transduction histidine kinase